MHPWGFYKRERWKEKLKGRVSSNCQAILVCVNFAGESPILIVKSQMILAKQKRQFKSDGKTPSQRAKLNDILQVVKQFYSNGLLKGTSSMKIVITPEGNGDFKLIYIFFLKFIFTFKR